MNAFGKRFQSHNDLNRQAITFFRFQNQLDITRVYDALVKGSGVFIDLSDMEEKELYEFKDSLQSVCTSTDSFYQEICEDYVACFPVQYHVLVA